MDSATQNQDIEPQSTVEIIRHAMITLAGDRGVDRARRGSEPGWVRMLSAEEEKSFHEASHLLVARRWFHVYRVSIEDHFDIKVGGGYVGGFARYGTAVTEPSIAPTPQDPIEDRDKFQAFLDILAGGHERIIPEIRDRLERDTDALIEEEWLSINAIVFHLIRERSLEQPRIEEILAPRTPRWE